MSLLKQHPRPPPSMSPASAISLILLSALISQAQSGMISPAQSTFVISNQIAPETAIQVRCSRSYGAKGLWWQTQEAFTEFPLFYQDSQAIGTSVLMRVNRIYQCKFMVNKYHECVYDLYSVLQDHRRCAPATGGCTWFVRPDGMYFFQGEDPEKAKLRLPHCSKIDIEYLRSWNHE